MDRLLPSGRCQWRHGLRGPEVDAGPGPLIIRGRMREIHPQPRLATLLARILINCAALAVSGAELSPPNWPQFRGPNSSGIAADAKPPVKISPTNGVLWKIDVAWSPSSPCVWRHRIFLTTLADGITTAFAAVASAVTTAYTFLFNEIKPVIDFIASVAEDIASIF